MIWTITYDNIEEKCLEQDIKSYFNGSIKSFKKEYELILNGKEINVLGCSLFEKLKDYNQNDSLKVKDWIIECEKKKYEKFVIFKILDYNFQYLLGQISILEKIVDKTNIKQVILISDINKEIKELMTNINRVTYLFSYIKQLLMFFI